MKNFIVLVMACFLFSMASEAHDFELETGLDMEMMDKIAQVCKVQMTNMDRAYENFMNKKSRSNEKKIDQARKEFDKCADNVPRHH